ncbi:MAG: hypothetical protein A3F41_01450 [Coxiella sp. RIFCSPHIGHO2_12_FULL_44_14]|nr:MAG: hypothetical protein A3F41_01450 [Coxiella sp. RIFCSPHIGHO2_12_FULL_44_14]
MGWHKERVLIIDDDLGCSGSSAEGRLGFQRLVAEVSMDRVGIIFGIEISRLARSCRDWHQLLEVCSLFNTLIADSDGVYDPGNYNDRLLLGLKGTMSEAELHIIKQRMLSGKKAKAKRGELGMQVPMGYITHLSGEIIKDPDEQAQSTIQLVFELFERYRTIHSVLRHLVKNEIFMPCRVRSGHKKGDLEWHRPNRPSLSNLLHNPMYAGAYVYGRRPVDPKKQKPGRPSTGKKTATPDEWEVLIKDKLPSYISWEKYEHNQRQLQMNTNIALGAPRKGISLLSGLLVCGRCGLKMVTRYTDKKAKLRYICCRMASDYAEEICQSLVGEALDKLITLQVLQAVQPSALEVSLKVAEDVEKERELILSHWKQKIERANYEIERAYRQYNAVEPENRLVVRTLEQKWEDTLLNKDKLEQDYQNFLSERPSHLTEKEREQIRTLASDIPMLWEASTTTQEQRQNIIRLLIKRVIVLVEGHTENVHVEIQWVGNHKTQTTFIRPVAKVEQLSYYKELLERVASLHKDGNNASTIADILNQENWKTAKQRGLFNTGLVSKMLSRQGLVEVSKNMASKKVVREKDELTIRELSEKVSIPEPTLYQWMRSGKIEARYDKSVSKKGVLLLKAGEKEIKQLIDLKNRPRRWWASEESRID